MLDRNFGFVPKGWGSEYIFASNDKYCGKLLNFDSGASFSMHFHMQKHETWLCLSGSFIVMRIDLEDASISKETFNAGMTIEVKPMQPHQLICIEAGTIVEVSTPDSIKDNYRVLPGDSQKQV